MCVACCDTEFLCPILQINMVNGRLLVSARGILQWKSLCKIPKMLQIYYMLFLLQSSSFQICPWWFSYELHGVFYYIFVYFGPQSGEIPKMTSLWCHDVIWCMTSFWGIPPIFGIQNKNKNVVKNATGFILKSSWILTNYIWLERGRLNLQQYAICEDPWGLYESQKLSKSAQILDFLKMPYRSHLCRCPADTSNQT